MFKEYGPKGLVVVGVTDEPKSLVGPDVIKKKMKYPVASAVGSDFMKQYGVGGFPTAFLIDAHGMVVWSGHPGNFEESMLEGLLAEVQLAPKLPEANTDIAALFEAKSYGKAWAALQKALVKAPDDADLKAASEGLSKSVESKLAEAKDYAAAGTFGEAQTLYHELLKDYAGVPGAEAAKAFASIAKKYPDTPSGVRAKDLAALYPLD